MLRVPTLILSSVLLVVVFVQSYIVYTSASNAGQASVAFGGAIGLFVALCWLIGVAFVMTLPRIAARFYLGAGLLALVANSEFPDLKLWGVVSLIFAVMAWGPNFKGAQSERPGANQVTAPGQQAGHGEERL